MKKLKHFKILFKYFKKDKLRLFAFLFMTVLKYFEPLLNAFIMANAFQALCDGNKTLFVHNLFLWSLIMIVAWVFIQLPTDLLYNKLEKDFMENICKDLYSKITDLPAVAFEDIGVGEFINRIHSDPDRILDLLQKLIKLTCRLIIAIIIVGISFTVSIYVGLELVFLCIVMYLLSNVYYPKLKKIHEEIKKSSDKLVNVATQNITGIREIKALGIKRNTRIRINADIHEVFWKQRRVGVNESVYYALNNFSYFVIQFIILLTLGTQVLNGLVTIASFVLIEKYIWRIDDVVESLSEFGVCFNKVTVSLKRIDEILNNRLYKDEKFGKKDLIDKKCRITFKDVVFKYRKEDKDYILKGLSLDFEPHKKIAVVGKSGQGKSTLFNLLLRYFDPNKGSIKINGIELKELSEKSLRDNISVIRQAPFLFNTTIFDNFKIVKEDVTLEEIRNVCKKAYIDDYIMSLPLGYDTLIGEGGINLSGGQKQRIAIARTLLKNTKVILFDEATSALDNESQEYIKKTIDDLVKTHTIIIVAHRLSTIMDADLIYVIEDGILSGAGTHEELMKSNKLYKKLYSPEVLDF